MRVLVVIGVLLAALGGYVLAGGLTYKQERGAIDLLVFKAAITEERSVPKWIGFVLIVSGAGAAWVGAGRR